MEVFEYSRNSEDGRNMRLVHDGYGYRYGGHRNFGERQIEIVNTTAGELYFLA